MTWTLRESFAEVMRVRVCIGVPKKSGGVSEKPSTKEKEAQAEPSAKEKEVAEAPSAKEKEAK